MNFSFMFAWFDFWVGMYFDRGKSWLYVLPIPMVGFIMKLPQRRYWLVSNSHRENIIGSTDSEGLEYALTQDNVHGRMYWAVNGSIKPLFGPDHHDDNEPPTYCCPSW